MAELQELQIQAYQVPQIKAVNFEEIKAAISQKAELYASIQYDELSIKQAKADKADLNRYKKALNDERIKREKEYNAPFKEFKAQVDEIIAILEKPIAAIDEQVKAYEERQKKEKLAEVRKIFDGFNIPDFMEPDELFERFMSPNYLNVSTSAKQIKESLSEKFEDLERSLEFCKNMPVYSEEAIDTFKRTLKQGLTVNASLEEAQKTVNNLMRWDKEREEREQREKAISEAKAAEMKEEKIVPVTPVTKVKEESLIDVTIQAKITWEQKTQIEEFFKSIGVNGYINYSYDTPSFEKESDFEKEEEDPELMF